jgi:hypothetical protein
MEAILIKLGFWDLVTGEEKLANEVDQKKGEGFSEEAS